MSAAAGAVKSKFTSFYRLAGMGYLDSLAVATTSLTKVLKEPARSEAANRSNFKYREFTFTDGKEDHPANESYSHPVSCSRGAARIARLEGWVLSSSPLHFHSHTLYTLHFLPCLPPEIFYRA